MRLWVYVCMFVQFFMFSCCKPLSIKQWLSLMLYFIKGLSPVPGKVTLELWFTQTMSGAGSKAQCPPASLLPAASPSLSGNVWLGLRLNLGLFFLSNQTNLTCCWWNTPSSAAAFWQTETFPMLVNSWSALKCSASVQTTPEMFTVAEGHRLHVFSKKYTEANFGFVSLPQYIGFLGLWCCFSEKLLKLILDDFF